MDRSLDEVISERKGSDHRPLRDRRYNSGPRDGIRKPTPWNDSRNLTDDWIHDRFEESNDSRRRFRNSLNHSLDRYTPNQNISPQAGARLKVENLHYELTEDDLRELFTRIGHVSSLSLLYDRQDRSKGVAFVTYANFHDAQSAIREFDGANANGQPIKLTLLPPTQAKSTRNHFDNVARPGRSLFERIDAPVGQIRGRNRSMGPVRHSDVSKPPPGNIDRYVPEQRGNNRSPYSRGSGFFRDASRRQHSRKDQTFHRDSENGTRHIAHGRPRKTVDELDAEMADYWGNKDGISRNLGEDSVPSTENVNGLENGAGMEDIDMIE